MDLKRARDEGTLTDEDYKRALPRVLRSRSRYEWKAQRVNVGFDDWSVNYEAQREHHRVVARRCVHPAFDELHWDHAWFRREYF